MEIEYLCDVVNRAFQRSIGPAEVVWSFAGIRALQDDGSTRASAVTRDYVLDLDAPAGAAPSLSIVGGKLTTYRILAEQALEKLEPCLGALPAPWTGSAPLPGGDIGGGNADALAPALGRLFPFLGDALARRLARAYGTRATRMLDGVRTRDDMGESFGGGLTRLEVDYLVREEWARSAEDVLWRHTKCGLAATPGDALRLRAYLGR
jgi:glycerol-3-phosphate dehydrogenase